MQYRVLEASVTATARPVVLQGGLINLDNLVKVSGSARVRISANANKRIKVGFVQVITHFAFDARYNAGPAGADAKFLCRVQPLPVRDSVRVSSKPWYDANERFSPVVISQGVARCSFTDEPSCPAFAPAHPDYGTLQGLTYFAKFTYWLALRDLSAPEGQGLVALYQATSTVRWIANNIQAVAEGGALAPVIVTCQGGEAVTTPIPDAIWADRIANGSIGTRWEETPAVRQLIDQRELAEQQRAAAAAQQAQALAAQQAAQRPLAAAAAADASAERRRKLLAMLGQDE
jgi:hypothetical protein